MGTEGNNIDDLFREKLGARESFPGPEGWMEAERLLNQKKKRRRGGFWIFWGFLLVGLTGFTFWYTGAFKAPSTNRVEVSTNNKPLTDSSPSSSTFNGIKETDQKSDRINSEVSSSEFTQESSPELEGGEGPKTPVNSAGNTLGRREIRQSRMGKAPERPADESLKNSVHHESDTGSGKDEGGNEKREFSELPDEPESNKSIFPYDPGYMSLLGQSGVRNDQNLAVPELFDPAFLPPPYMTPLPSTSLEGAFDMAQTRSSFGNSQNPLLIQRDEQEKPVITNGFDLMFTHRRQSLRYGLGLMYQNTGEDVQYSAQIERDSIVDNSYYEIIETWGEYVDSTLIDNVWVYDTIEYVISVDSTFFELIDTTVYFLNDEEIQKHNGRTSIQTISIPIQFGYEWIRNRSSWYFYGSVDPTWIIRRTATYLHSGSNTTRDITQIDTYRRMAWRASLGVAWNRELLANRAYLIVNPFARFNLSSWNSSFDHKYMDLGLRIGVGLWIK